MLFRLLLQATRYPRLRSLAWTCLFISVASVLYAGGGPRNVVVVRNLDSPVSKQIAGYYASARHIPDENICDIHCSTSELVSRAVCEGQIIAPLRAFVQKPELDGHIDYIVLTKGCPLMADYGWSSGPLSITSILTCLTETTITQYLNNPYGPAISAPVETAFSHQLSLGGKHLFLVTRLDGYTVDNVLRMIDGSLAATSGGPFLIDRTYLPDSYQGGYRTLNDRLQLANSLLVAKGIPTIYDDSATFIGGRTGLMGYFSWGSNDSSFDMTAYRSNLFAPGSIADTYVSSSARTFIPGAPGQSLIGDLIANGACGVSGYVSEPYTAYSTYPNVLFDRYTKGYNMAESFYMACPELFWKSAVVGDPLMAPFAVPPTVSVIVPADPLTGAQAVLAADAHHANGIASVSFYVDGQFVGKSVQAPFSVVCDTTGYVVGPHTVEAVATEAGPVSVQATTVATVQVSNAVSMLKTISDAYGSPDGQGVHIAGRIVVAGTAEMGGNEFYIQDSNRAGGFHVSSSVPVAEGDVVTIDGTLESESGERSIAATDVTVTDQLLTLLKPMCVRSSAIGGGSFSANTPGVTDGTGLRNLGLLVKVSGGVTYVGDAGETFFYIDDGCALSDGSGHTGLRIECRDLPKPAMRSVVCITGISSCRELNASVIRTVKARRGTDISTIFSGF